MLGAFIAASQLSALVLRPDVPPTVWWTSLAFSVPLLAPWRLIRLPALWWALFSVLCIGAGMVLYAWITSVPQSFAGSSDALKVICLVGLAGASIICLNIPAVVALRRRQKFTARTGNA